MRAVVAGVRGETKAFPPMAHALAGARVGAWHRNVTRRTGPTTATSTLAEVAHAVGFTAVTRTLLRNIAGRPRVAGEAVAHAVDTSTVTVAAVHAQHLTTTHPAPSVVAFADW